jgi:hypothetical protein
LLKVRPCGETPAVGVGGTPEPLTVKVADGHEPPPVLETGIVTVPE